MPASTDFQLSRSIEILERTPATLRALLDGVSDFWSLRNYGPDTFSPFDVVGHLIHAEQTNWMPRVRTILEHGQSQAFPTFDRYAMYEISKGKSMRDLLTTFSNEREKSLNELRGLNLTEAQMSKLGTHPQIGPVQLRHLLSAWPVHDLNHIHQIAKSMAYQYRDAVGPWREFLTILPKP